MIIRERIPTPKRLNKDIHCPDHPGDPKWIDLDEWRQLRETTAIEMQKEEPLAVRFRLDSSSWGAVNEDATDAGWGMPNAASSQPWGTVNQSANDSGWGAPTNSTSSNQGWETQGNKTR
ncbi:hypothetical protein INT43_007502 [Umbelopsis isabellina]|uniref:Uncharacterized protein n=1 Tax=Mortierella isabellina TaxID=91625 RepID=A0A8H7UEC7_MORIS|nr:hypothetical protein INT43_007502 [Umbelopsis isabellina]